MTQYAGGKVDDDIDRVKARFHELTGVQGVQVVPKRSGPETFYHIRVGRPAPIYEEARIRIDEEMGDDSPLHGSLLVTPDDERKGLESLEVQALTALISRSLSVSREQMDQETPVLHVRFASGEDARVLEPTGHVIWGRRGVGKSSLILVACRELRSRQNPVAWVGGEAYQGREDPAVLFELLDDVFGELGSSAGSASAGGGKPFERARELVCPHLRSRAGVTEIRNVVRPLKRCVKEHYSDTKRYCYVFVDDAHMINHRLQPLAYRTLLNVFHGSGGVVNLAGVKTLMRLSDPDAETAIQIPDDLQRVPLDRTLVDPAEAKRHLEEVLLEFLKYCGVKTISSVLNPQAVDRLVWSSAGVPRDFLWLVGGAIEYARRHRRRKVGKEDVNQATGDLRGDKLERIEAEGVTEGGALQEALDRLQKRVLDGEARVNAFLVRLQPRSPGYQNVLKLADLRLIHLINPSITPSNVGEKYEAYLLDYSLYTGVRRRHRIQELEIEPGGAPKYATLRKLPKFEPEFFQAQVPVMEQP